MKRKTGLRIDTVLPKKVLGKASNYDFVVPYAGRWVIIVGGKVVADGETANDAMLRTPNKIGRGKSLLFKVPAEPDKLLVV